MNCNCIGCTTCDWTDTVECKICDGTICADHRCGTNVVLCGEYTICKECYNQPNNEKIKCIDCGIEYGLYIIGNTKIYAQGLTNKTKYRKPLFMRKCVELGCFEYVCYNCNDWEGGELLDCGNHDTDNGVCVSCKGSFARDEMINDAINDIQNGLVCVDCDSVNDVHRFNDIEFL